MKNIEEKVQSLIEIKNFENLSPVEQEMVFSIMTEEEYTERYMLLQASKEMFEHERTLIVPDAKILSSLKVIMQESEETNQKKAGGWAWLGYKVSLVKSVAASLLLLLGSYFLFAQSEPEVQYIEKKVFVEKKVFDTVFAEKLVEVPVEKIVKVVEFKRGNPKSTQLNNNLSFAVKEQDAEKPVKSVELNEINNSYGNSKIDEEELEQFRVSL